MKEIAFIDGRTKIRIKDDQLAAYLDSVESAGYMVRANKCTYKIGSHETWSSEILMIGKPADFEEFFSKKTRIKEIYKQFPQVYRLLFNDREILLYLLKQDYEIV
ncbi:hypothetical protein ANME2D_01046 [Candidatus Methanoperedens nitroreducens]|uniref:Uncharacterized protein n=1 Tax=Candidatus Methanoperedens nitratireducens TaxID=1392998 RepID=A0A062V0E5_9EURY|nr:hypothetical protein [Candidatus Methanoperedens nitroreducens]KCZ72616.1 hypothetical protein ANME2D_01046 [Candidatus Methanoperedens nitroreducens]MDJ1423452.1 hypothetical protein [Candidatus Methanoperedens sp.]